MNERLRRSLLLASGLLMLALYWATFVSPFMPTVSGTLGHDHRGSLVEATIGYVHFQKSPFSIPWFTPASCAGNMYIAGAANPYLNLQQWLTFFLDPLSASKINFIVFAGLGLTGTYLLCRRRFNMDTISSFLGASLFLFNGFFAYRMVIGHTAFHSYMLIPLIAFLLIPGDLPARTQARNMLVAATLIAYLILASGAYVLLTAGLALTGILAMHTLACNRREPGGFMVLQPFLPLAAAFTVAILLCLFKISLTLSTAANFERDFYPIPGLINLLDTVTLPLRLLFFSTPEWETESGYLFTNFRWPIERHELEMNVGTPALLLLVFAAVTSRSKIFQAVRQAPMTSLVLLTVVLVPMVLNFYQPVWNDVLKSIPVLRSFSLYVRLYAAYIPLVVLATALAFSCVPRYRLPLCIALLAGTVASHWLIDRSYYAQQKYNPQLLLEFYERFRDQPGQIPPVNTTSELKVASFSGEAVIVQNEMFAFGSSNIECHNDMFGYRLEVFPKRDLLIPNASVFTRSGDRLNFKNPSCHVFPKANQCEPGDHFTAAQQSSLENFVRYRGFEFNMPGYQWVSTATSLVTLLMVVFGLITLSRPLKQ